MLRISSIPGLDEIKTHLERYGIPMDISRIISSLQRGVDTISQSFREVTSPQARLTLRDRVDDLKDDIINHFHKLGLTRDDANY